MNNLTNGLKGKFETPFEKSCYSEFALKTRAIQSWH